MQPGIDSLAPSAAFPHFVLPHHLEASEPPEARGLERDQVRLMVTFLSGDRVHHTRFDHLPDFLLPGDLLVINTSGTMNASVPARRDDGTAVDLHLSTLLPGNLWTVEVREPRADEPGEGRRIAPPEVLHLPGGGRASILSPYSGGCDRPVRNAPARLWLATLQTPESIDDYLTRYGSPIRYSYVRRSWPPSFYQTVYATETGSAEMPSAGRAFTSRLMATLIGAGIQFAPLLLHTGVASLESHEPPYEEFYRVPLATAVLVNSARANGGRVIAVGTTVVRALETVTDARGTVHPGEGWTCTVITPETGVRAVAGLLTGLHEPRSSHLLMLEAIAGRRHLEITYAEALDRQYLWHEFGDLHLIVP